MNIKKRARAGDRQALEVMFRQFIPADEVIEDVAFLGERGVFGLGTHSFAAVTDRRVASLQLSMLGRATYIDGYHEHINSSAVMQPSRSHEFIACVVALVLWFTVLYQCVALRYNDKGEWVRTAFGRGPEIPDAAVIPIVAAWIAVSVLFAPVAARLLYRFSKSGLVINVRNGIPVYCFTDRARMGRANQLASVATLARERRVPLGFTPGESEQMSTSSVTAEPRRVPLWARWSEHTAARTIGGVVTVLAIVRSVAAPNQLGQIWKPVWSPSLLQYALPTLALYLAAAALALATQQRTRAVAIGAVLGLSLAIGMQSLVGFALGTGLSWRESGFWVVNATGVAIAAVAVVGWVLSPLPMRTCTVEEDVAMAPGLALWMTTGGFAMLIGSLMPWQSGAWLWGMATPTATSYLPLSSTPYRQLFMVTYAAATLLGVGIPLAALGRRRRLSTPSVLTGWSLGILMMLVTIDLEQGRMEFGFLLAELGAVVTLVGSVGLLVAAPIRRRLRSFAASHTVGAAWPPPTVRAD